MTKEVKFEIGKNFNGCTMKNMSLVTTVVDPSELLNKTIVGVRRIPVNDYPFFSKEEYKEVRELYIIDFLATGVTPVELSHEEPPDHLVDVYYLNIKIKPKSFAEGPSRSARPPTKAARTSRLGLLRVTMKPKAKDVSSMSATPF